MADVFSGEDGGYEPPLSAVLGVGAACYLPLVSLRQSAGFSQGPSGRPARPLLRAAVATDCPAETEGRGRFASLLPKRFCRPQTLRRCCRSAGALLAQRYEKSLL